MDFTAHCELSKSSNLVFLHQRSASADLRDHLSGAVAQASSTRVAPYFLAKDSMPKKSNREVRSFRVVQEPAGSEDARKRQGQRYVPQHLAATTSSQKQIPNDLSRGLPTGVHYASPKVLIRGGLANSARAVNDLPWFPRLVLRLQPFGFWVCQDRC